MFIATVELFHIMLAVFLLLENSRLKRLANEKDMRVKKVELDELKCEVALESALAGAKSKDIEIDVWVNKKRFAAQKIIAEIDSLKKV